VDDLVADEAHALGRKRGQPCGGLLICRSQALTIDDLEHTECCGARGQVAVSKLAPEGRELA
jgi:hypothetical protein